MNKRLTKLVTTLALIATVSTTAVLAEPLSDKLNSQQKQLQQHKTEYKNAQKKLDEMESAIERLDDQIETAMYEIEKTKNKIESIKINIELAEKEIQKSEEDIKAEKELYNKRMRTMYMNGSGGYLDVILGAKDLSDLFSKVQAVKKITELDKKIVEELRQKQDEIKIKKEELNKEKNELVTLNVEQEERMEKLKKDKAEQDKLVKEARKQSSLYASKVKNDEKLIRETMKIIEDMGNQNSSSNNNDTPSRGDEGSVTGQTVVVYAKKFLGTPYVWGATGPNSFDCSGFVKYVYAHFGVRLPRVSRDQATAGKYVSRSNLQPGDLVFFGRSRIHHVGMYVGNGCYIHAPRTGDVVKISSLSGRSDYATARRVK